MNLKKKSYIPLSPDPFHCFYHPSFFVLFPHSQLSFWQLVCLITRSNFSWTYVSKLWLNQGGFFLSWFPYGVPSLSCPFDNSFALLQGQTVVGLTFPNSGSTREAFSSPDSLFWGIMLVKLTPSTELHPFGCSRMTVEVKHGIWYQWLVCSFYLCSWNLRLRLNYTLLAAAGWR